MNVVIIGATGAIGSALVEKLSEKKEIACIYAFSRQKPAELPDKVRYGFIDLLDEQSIENAAETAARAGPLKLVIVATGILHGDNLKPEKALKYLSSEEMTQMFLTNSIGPALVMKHFLPKLCRKEKAMFAAISARVGSISDNALGGWYSYRASKAALNMIIKTTSIEAKRKNPDSIIVGLHPGTVNSDLSAPFTSGVPEGSLFSPQLSASHLLNVLDSLSSEDTGCCFAWDGSAIPA
jgi:NAD(P)-dependent dehydrogenase (short-subunit alcohol dehydrogenase family)